MTEISCLASGASAMVSLQQKITYGGWGSVLSVLRSIVALTVLTKEDKDEA